MSIVVSDPADDDPRLAPFYHLTAKHTERSDTVLVESELAVRRALHSGVTLTALLCTPARHARLAPLLEPSETVVFALSLSRMRHIVGFDIHRGCIACCRRPSAHSLPSLLENRRTSALKLLVVEQVADEANIGAIVRNARAFGVDAVCLDPGCGDPFSRRAIRSSAGHVFAQLLVEYPAHRMPAWCASHGIVNLAATVGKDAVPIQAVDAASRWALYIGNEGRGLSQAVLSGIARRVVIPMQCGVDSLNVAAATAVLLFALTSSE